MPFGRKRASIFPEVVRPCSAHLRAVCTGACVSSCKTRVCLLSFSSLTREERLQNICHVEQAHAEQSHVQNRATGRRAPAFRCPACHTVPFHVGTQHGQAESVCPDPAAAQMQHRYSTDSFAGPAPDKSSVHPFCHLFVAYVDTLSGTVTGTQKTAARLLLCTQTHQNTVSM